MASPYGRAQVGRRVAGWLEVNRATLSRAEPSSLFAQRNVHPRRQILHLRVLSCPASPHPAGLRRLARLCPFTATVRSGVPGPRKP